MATAGEAGGGDGCADDDPGRTNGDQDAVGSWPGGGVSGGSADGQVGQRPVPVGVRYSQITGWRPLASAAIAQSVGVAAGSGRSGSVMAKRVRPGWLSTLTVP